MFSVTWKSIVYLIMFPNIFAQDPVANLPQGRVMGIKAYVGPSLTPVEIYYGIPYATPPKGRYRFSAPERHGGWRRTFFAHRIPPHCPHAGDTQNDHFSEDCLFLNIWTPRVIHSDGKSSPVVVILYSESWTKGGVSLPCQELAAAGVVVVTVIYRLHLLAFFTLRSVSARGNLALLDQYLALLWVRENIPAFGGDPSAITVLGHSAGADSVLHLITSPRTVGLFQKAIIMSPVNIWKAIGEQRVTAASEVERISREIARSLGCNSDTDQEILQCMRGRTLSDLLPLYSNATWNKWMQPIPDNFLPESEQFLPNSLSVALSTATLHTKLDVLLGANDLEVLNDEKYEDMIKQGSSYYASEYVDTVVIPESLQRFSLDQPEIVPTMTQAVRWEYWNEKSKANIGALDAIELAGRIESTVNWSAGVALVAAKLTRGVARLYVYRYSQPSGVDLRGRKYNFTGAVHGSDLVSLLGDSLISQVARRPGTLEEKRVSSLLRKYVINFITFGSPGEEDRWRQHRAGDAHIFDIRDVEYADSNYYRSPARDVKFWLKYLPELSSLLKSAEKSEQLTADKGESRLRGGVFAMCGIASLLLLLLCACAILLHRQRSRRFTVVNDAHH